MLPKSVPAEKSKKRAIFLDGRPGGCRIATVLKASRNPAIQWA